jgi:NADH dehydrogenase [ubiquinone] 1 alpha subcomplex assembly factor 7
MAIEAEIRKQITKYGHINISRLMSFCLSELDCSYYKSKAAILDPSSPNDFLTSPSISQMFGEIISLWCIETWKRLGSPNNFNLIEFGSGDGSLLFDILRTTQKICPPFYSAANVKIIDINEKLIQKQKTKLESHLFFPQSINPTNPTKSTEIIKITNKITWYKSFSELKNQMLPQNHNNNESLKTKSILIANEFFDALPINQYIKIGNSWHEIVLMVDEITKKLKFDRIRLTEKHSSILNSEHPNSIDGSVYEESPESIELIKEIADFFSPELSSSNIPTSSQNQSPSTPQSTFQPNFSFLIIDYGYEISNYTRAPIQYKNTLQAIKSHKYVNPLSTLGEADISAHVNFHKLKEIAKSRFLKTEGTISQKDFLISYGINSRKEMLITKNPQNQQLTNLINAQYDRLVNKMGSLFKCLVINDFHR